MQEDQETPKSGSNDQIAPPAPIDLNVNILFISAQIVLIVYFTRLSSILDQLDLYFSFQSMFFDDDAAANPLALIIKLAIPVAAAFLITAGVAILNSSLRREQPPSPETPNLKLSAQCGGFAAAVLLAWPMIVHWDILANRQISDSRAAFLMIYGLYAISFYYFSGVGVDLASRMFRDRLPQGEEPVRPGKIIAETSIASVVAGVASVVMAQFGIAA